MAYLVLAFAKLFLGFPFMIILLGVVMLFMMLNLPNMSTQVVIQQVLNGISPPSLVAVPMFILGASILTTGTSARRLVNMIKVFLGHLPGGLPITTAVSCALFGAVSGSTQATVAAIGGTMRPMLLESGYKSSFTLGLIINSSDIAFLIPPSIGFIVYGVVTSTSIGKLFLAGIGPGVLIVLLFSLYTIIYSKAHKVGIAPKSTWAQRKQALKDGIPVMGFPLIIIGGIYSGVFSPTEASAAAVVYALFLEGILYRTLNRKNLMESFLSTGIVTGVVFILVGAGQALSFLISFMKVPQAVLPSILGAAPSYIYLIFIINLAYFFACMFVDPIVAIYVLTPVFAPYVLQAGVDPVLLGVLVTLQAAIGSATPPFGCDIFTAQLIFRRPYLEVIGHTYPFVIILLVSALLIVAFPQIALWLPTVAGI